MKCNPAENKIMIPAICQNDNIRSLNSTNVLSKNGIIPPNANGPKDIPPITKPIISEIPKCLQILPSNIDGITKTKIPTNVGIASNSVTIDH